MNSKGGRRVTSRPPFLLNNDSLMKWIYLMAALLVCPNLSARQNEKETFKASLKTFFNAYPKRADVAQPTLKDLKIDEDEKAIYIYPSESFAYLPFRPEEVEELYHNVEKLRPRPWKRFKIHVIANGTDVRNLVPNFYRKKRDKDMSRLAPFRKTEPEESWTRNISRPYLATKGLSGNHIAMAQSHGNYFKNEQWKWSWQRPRLFCTTEDLFTQSFAVSFIIPMLENAGAVVFTPRERDIQKNEVLVDNDTRTSSLYIEENSRRSKWKTTDFKGFKWNGGVCDEPMNPFEMGTARFIATERKSGKAFAEWIPDIPETGAYAVYVSYQSLPQSVSDAHYVVFHKGGITEFEVNQRMGGNTWVYLGTFEFEKGTNEHGMVLLSNQSSQKGVVCADAVRFGGGMGNVIRHGSTSGMPRYLEGARYNAQWAGMPYEVYSGRQGTNDYADDINVRSLFANHLSGGSKSNPNRLGKNVPFDVSVAIHSDAGHRADGKLMGTLGIYTTQHNDGKLAAGNSRFASRDLADIIMSQIEKDVESRFNVDWNRRGMWDRNYSETRLPAVPSVIIETLSHQNFADMKWGHDPNFKFTFSRAIYKGILKFLAEQEQRKYVVQPLPVSHFAADLDFKKPKVTLSWRAVDDPDEPTASPHSYIVYTRTNNGSFDNGVKVKDTSVTLDLTPGVLYSFKVAALNDGGESFPSEILAVYKSPEESRRALIVNGFDRICGPAVVDDIHNAGFLLNEDPGIPYLYSTSFCGEQLCFDRRKGGKEGPGSLGHSSDTWEGITIAGNTFDYPYVHGKAMLATPGISFASCSDEALEDETITPATYQVIDYIQGMEKEEPDAPTYYKTFSSSTQRILTAFCRTGGDVLVSGSYVGSDMSQTHGNREFIHKVLKYSYSSTITDKSTEAVSGLRMNARIPRQPNSRAYVPASMESITPTDGAFTVFTYLPSQESAGIAYNGNDYQTFVLGFPFECIASEQERNTIMASILHFFEH